MGIDVLYLVGGILLLYGGGDYLVKSAVSLANHFKVSPFFIGIVIISLGTSFPELIVSVDAAFKGHPDISLGNIVGSNIANIALALGITAVVLPVAVRKKKIWFDWLILFIISAFLIVFSFLNVNRMLNQLAGIILLSILGYYYFVQIRDARKERKNIKVEIPRFNIGISLLIMVISFVALAFGAEGVILGGSHIAEKMGISERVISLTIIAFGTSLPEIATSFMAALRKQLDISIANVLGSNIFNAAGVLGITSLIKPIHINERILQNDYWWMMGFLVLLVIFIFSFKRRQITRVEGLIFLVVYIVYVYLLF